ncbi:Tryptophan synthase, beta chain [Parasponia andersonii]|uniref:Tryptophan synthase n=1 Tax=Parasponia andersonii TaxID=3476 RepID=A0A2P5A8M5_PARAD|nr:Tryptophan synthase, beta chain [Parasponia andersonii]
MACGTIKTLFTSHKVGSASCHWSATAKTRRPGRDSVAICGARVIDGNTNTVNSTTTVKEVPLATSPFILSGSLMSRTLRPETHDDQERAVIGNGKFGRFGGKFVPETLMASLNDLEAEFRSVLHDAQFQVELETALRDYVGRETPLYLAERLTEHYKGSSGEGPEIYLKREDLTHGGAHKMNNAIAQAMIARRMGRASVVAATGTGQHGVATTAACAKLSLECKIFMGTKDVEKQSSNVLLMKLLGAQVKTVEGNFKDASSEAMRNWANNLETSYYLPGTVVGPHPCPSMVREFQSVIGKETRKQAMEKWGRKPDVLVACVGSGSNALGLFHEFIGDEDVRLIGVEGAGMGLDSGPHSATLARGEMGVYHGAMSYLLQDSDGQILGPHSIGVGLEGIFPALEASHALAYLNKLCPTLPNGTKVVVNCSGRGDKDAAIVFNSSL